MRTFDRNTASIEDMRRHVRFWPVVVLSVLAGLTPFAKSFGQDDVNPDEIIRRFAEKETEFREVWAHYAYTEQIRFQVLDREGNAKEQRDITMDVYFTTEGERKTEIVADRGELFSVQVSPEDLSDATGMQPFVLTTEQLPNYKIEYIGKERVDELDTYVFDVEPRDMKPGQRYFKGRIWVDDVDLQIVMSRGKIKPDSSTNKFPEFETVRQQVDGKYWFPTWTKAEDVLTFGSRFSVGSIFGGGSRNFQRVHVRQYINYEDFKKFEVGTSIHFGDDPEPGNRP